MIFVLDNYDSFTYNLVQRLGEIDPSLDIHVARNDRVGVGDIERLSPDRIIISPGPCTPREAGISTDVVRHFAPRVPMLGVCLGHQCMAVAFGGQVVAAPRLMHGKTSEIHHDGRGLFDRLPNPCTATRYHSLIVPEDSLPDEIQACAWTRDDDAPRELMGFRHRSHPLHAVQFHPESFLTTAGTRMLQNFLTLN